MSEVNLAVIIQYVKKYIYAKFRRVKAISAIRGYVTVLVKNIYMSAESA